ncbi:hypothetical protein DFJ73DRAFT_622935 [Zopfochytrium polystomum]|nr:hypothetical protein DFJ73DRAFT_622935 [Zopfochytrium polystomum]
MRTTEEFLIQATSILMELKSTVFPNSFMIEFMHLVIHNTSKLLLSLWKGNILSDKGKVDYIISDKDLIEIRKACAASRTTIPSSIVGKLSDIHKSESFHSAETKLAWILFYGPAQLDGKLPKPYFTRFLEFY